MKKFLAIASHYCQWEKTEDGQEVFDIDDCSEHVVGYYGDDYREAVTRWFESFEPDDERGPLRRVRVLLGEDEVNVFDAVKGWEK